MTGDQLRAAAEDAYNRSAWRAAQRLTDQAVEAAIDRYAALPELWILDVYDRLNPMARALEVDAEHQPGPARIERCA